MKAMLLEAERLLNQYAPADFGPANLFALTEICAAMANVEDEEAWRGAYPSPDAFYAAHEAKHPSIRLYGKVQREVTSITDPLRDPRGGTFEVRLARMEAEQAG